MTGKQEQQLQQQQSQQLIKCHNSKRADPNHPVNPKPLPPLASAVKVLNSISLRVNLNVNEQSTKREREQRVGEKDRNRGGRLVDKMLLANVSIKSTAKNLIFFHLARNVEMNILLESATPPSPQKWQRDRYLDR